MMFGATKRSYRGCREPAEAGAESCPSSSVTRSTGEKSIDTLRTKGNLAKSLLAVGGEANADRARVLLEESLAVLTRNMGPRDRFTLITKDNLADARAQTGEPKRALKMREE